MTRKQELFIKHYVLTSNATESAKKAGYSQRTAYSSGQRLLKDVEIKSRIDAEFERIVSDLDMSEEDIKSEFSKIAKGEGKFQAKDRLHALDSLARIKGMFKENEGPTINIVSLAKNSRLDKVKEVQEALRNSPKKAITGSLRDDLCKNTSTYTKTKKVS